MRRSGPNWGSPATPDPAPSSRPGPSDAGTPASILGPTIIFDTDCVLCSGVVAFILAHERDRALNFAGAWSEEGLALAARHHVSRAELHETFLMLRDGAALTRSDAALALLTHLRAPWRWLTMLRVVPRPLRDAVYGFVARRRYRWFGQSENCTLVPRSERHRFIGVRGRAGS